MFEITIKREIEKGTKIENVEVVDTTNTIVLALQILIYCSMILG